MAFSWFRFHSEFLTDPKVQMLSEPDQRRFIMLLCIRCSNGHVTLHETGKMLHETNTALHETKVAFQLRITKAQWCKTKANLMAQNLIDELGNPTAWDKRQYVSDSSTARVSKHRAKKKEATKEATKNMKRYSNGDVTPPDTDTDTDTDKNKTGEQVRQLFDFWQDELNHPRAKLDSKRRRAIKARLKDGYTVDDIQKAITGCKHSPFHQGENDNKSVHDDIELICRNAVKLDQFIDMTEQKAAGQSATDSSRIAFEDLPTSL